MGDAEGCLGYHAGRFGILDGGDDVALVVQSAEDSGDVGTLRMLHLIEQLAQVLGAGTHAEAVERTVEHMCLDAGLAEGTCPRTYRLVGVLAEKEVHLFETSAICLHAVEASHADDDRGYLEELVDAGLVFARTLPHVAEDEA